VRDKILLFATTESKLFPKNSKGIIFSLKIGMKGAQVNWPSCFSGNLRKNPSAKGLYYVF
jgi:hypothetical protein